MDSCGYDLDYIFSWWCNLLWSRVTWSNALFEEHLLQWHALQIYPWENSSLPHVRDFQYTEVSPGRLSADAKNLTLHFIQAKRIYKFKRQQELACFQISLRNLWQLETSNGTKMDATVVSIGWISGYPWMPISFTTPWAFMAKKNTRSCVVRFLTLYAWWTMTILCSCKWEGRSEGMCDPIQKGWWCHGGILSRVLHVLKFAR